MAVQHPHPGLIRTGPVDGDDKQTGEHGHLRFAELICFLTHFLMLLTKARSSIHWNSKQLCRYLQHGVIRCEVYLSPTAGDNVS